MTISGMLANPLITPNLTDVVAEFGQLDSKASLLVAVVPLPGILLALLIGLMADRYGRRRVVVLCLALFGTAGLASAIAPTFEILLLSRFIQGFGSAGLLNLSIVLIADHWSGEQRTTIMGRNSAALAIGLVAVPPVSGLLASLTSWRWSLAIATIAIPLALMAYKTLPSQAIGGWRSTSGYLEGLKASLRSPVVLATLITGFALFAVIFGVFTTALPIHLANEFELGSGVRGAVLATPAITSVAASLYLGKISKAASTKKIIFIAGALISCSAFAIGATSTLWVVIAASLVYGLGDGVLIPTLQSIVATSVPSEKRASVLALWTSFVRLGQLTGPLVAGLLIHVVNTGTVMIVGAVGFGLVSLFWLKTTLDLSFVSK